MSNRTSIFSNTISDPPTTSPSEPKRNNAGEILPDVGLKWGRRPRSKSSSSNELESRSLQFENNMPDPKPEKPDFENFYSEAEKAKMRAKGINPALKAEMEAHRKDKGKGIWGKVAQTAVGGGCIK